MMGATTASADSDKRTSTIDHSGNGGAAMGYAMQDALLLTRITVRKAPAPAVPRTARHI